jgi:hypothetical protein
MTKRRATTTGFQPTSIKLAAIVPLLAVGSLGLFVGLEVVFGGSVAKQPKPALARFGPTRDLVATYGSLDPILAPPKDIQRSVFVPASCVVDRNLATGADASRPSVATVFRCEHTSGFLVSFYRAQLPHSDWKVFSDAPTTHDGGGLALLSQKPGSDGFYWQLGVVIGNSTYTSSGGGVPTQSTPVTIRLFQNASN